MSFIEDSRVVFQDITEELLASNKKDVDESLFTRAETFERRKLVEFMDSKR